MTTQPTIAEQLDRIQKLDKELEKGAAHHRLAVKGYEKILQQLQELPK